MNIVCIYSGSCHHETNDIDVEYCSLTEHT